MIFSPLEFEFSLEPGMSDSEIEQLWLDTQAAQSALDRFLAGELTEAEMTDVLSMADLDIDTTRKTLESNAEYLQLTPI
jgi:hypothetical protein